ncbi:MAG TPA: ABC transporter permease [Oligoflexus sp.]|uniref:ABC transporter permease n=1 Tax=Oligoflexus sp. TaxID=1971216 RepID=UPI002D5E0424|nr:ABC transporter permease [Oligoflexus sp.]HYX35945.1 ABC transporter permease [Oligoflexus sp.]
MLAKFALRNIRRNQRRSLVALGTIAVGVFGLLFLQGFFSGLIALHKENSIHSRFGHGQIMTKGYWGQAFEKPWEHWLKDPEAIMQYLRQQPHVQAVFPRVQFFALLSNGRMNVAGRGQGVVGAEEKNFFNKMNFIEGGAIGGQRDGMVLGVGLARALGVKVGDNLTVMGQTIDGTINAIDARVTGIFQVGMKEADDTLFQVQLSEAQILLNTQSVESITIGLDDEAHWESLSQGLGSTFPDYEALSIYVLDQVWAENGQLFLTALLNIFRLVFLGMIMLAIYNSASNTVLERKRELGMLRANGESPQDLIQLLVLEGLYLALAGATLGIIMTLVVHILSGHGIPMPPTPGTNRLLPVRLHLESSSIAMALLLGVLTSTAATFLSTLQVLRLSIVQAIRAAA